MEAFCEPLAHACNHKGTLVARSRFSYVMGAMPQNTAIICIGTLDSNSCTIPQNASFFISAPLAGLSALGLGTRRQGSRDGVDGDVRWSPAARIRLRLESDSLVWE